MVNVCTYAAIIINVTIKIFSVILLLNSQITNHSLYHFLNILQIILTLSYINHSQDFYQ